MSYYGLEAIAWAIHTLSRAVVIAAAVSKSQIINLPALLEQLEKRADDGQEGT